MAAFAPIPPRGPWRPPGKPGIPQNPGPLAPPTDTGPPPRGGPPQTMTPYSNSPAPYRPGVTAPPPPPGGAAAGPRDATAGILPGADAPLFWGPGQVSQLGNQQVNQLAAGRRDAVADLEAALAGTGARGALAERLGDLDASTAAQAAAARTDASLTAFGQNADRALNKRNQDITGVLQTRAQDFDLASEQGRQRLQWELGMLNSTTANRGLDIDWLKSLLGAQTTERGQDVQSRIADLGYGVDHRRIDSAERSADMDYLLGGRGQDTQRYGAELDQLARMLGLEVQQRDQDLDYDLGQRQLQQRGSDQLVQLLELLMRYPGGPMQAGGGGGYSMTPGLGG